MKLTWLNNGFICKELYAPYEVSKDNDYMKDLSEKYSLLLKQATKSGADIESINIIKKYRDKIIEALKCYYYRADIGKSNTIIRNLLKEIGENPFAVSSLNSSYAFPKDYTPRITFFRVLLSIGYGRKKSKKSQSHYCGWLLKNGDFYNSIPGMALL